MLPGADNTSSGNVYSLHMTGFWCPAHGESRPLSRPPRHP